MIDPFKRVNLGSTGLTVTQLGFGGLPIGNLYKSVTNEEGKETVRQAYKAGIRYFDTAPLYGLGKSEILMGEVLREFPRKSFVLSSKVGRLIVTGETPKTKDWIFSNIFGRKPVFDFSREGILRSLEESYKRLRIDHIDIVYIHDPDNNYKQALEEAYPVLDKLRSQKVIKAIGVGMNQVDMLCDFAREGDFDCFLLAGRYTLLDQSALHNLFPICMKKGISIVLGGAYNSGILATGPIKSAKYNYHKASQDILNKTKKIESVCSRYRVSLKAVALQFLFGHHVVKTNVQGTSSPKRLAENIRLMWEKIPIDLWSELKSEDLLDQMAPVPGY